MTEEKSEAPQKTTYALYEDRMRELLTSGDLTDEQINSLAKLKDMVVEDVAKEAKRKFDVDMAAVQAKCATIKANARNTYHSSNFADLHHINESFAPAWTSHGFSLSFNETARRDEEGFNTIELTVSHIGGHEQKYVWSPRVLPKTEKSSIVQVQASGITYARRYLISMAFNIGVDNDNDGNPPARSKSKASNATEDDGYIKPSLVVEIVNELKELGADKKKFLTVYKVESVGKLKNSDYPKIRKQLDRKRAQQQEEAKNAG